MSRIPLRPAAAPAPDAAPPRLPGSALSPALTGSLTGALAVVCVLGCVLGCAVHLGPRSAHLTAAELAGFRHDRGEALLSRLDCVACHTAEPATRSRLAPLPAPDLTAVGARRPASWLADFLDAPHAAGGQAVMPDLLGPLDPDERREAAEELLHFLVSLGGPMTLSPEVPDDWPIEAGGAAFTSLGCLACHEDDLARWSAPDSELARGYDRRSLGAFLQDPLAVRPSGEMPDMDLDVEEADALAAWLLRIRFLRGPTRTVQGPGLSSDVHVFDEDLEELPDLDTRPPSRTLRVATVEHEEGEVTDRYAVRLRGELLVPTTGEHTLYTNSDDGSALWVDGERVVDNDGVHGPQRADGTVTLEAGWHALEVAYFENTGGASLEAGWVIEAGGGSEDETRPFSTDELRTTLHLYEPDGWETLEPDARLVRGGRARFAELGCVSCHALDGLAAPDGAPPLDELLWMEDGCLATEVRDGLPDYHLDDRDRTALREVLRGAPALEQPLDAARVVERTLARLDCTACHSRGSAPGPQGAPRAAFTAATDMGDEGRIPPDLTGLGGKLRTSALHEVLVGSARVRPYMDARMPHFGEAAVGHLAQAFADADSGATEEEPDAPSTDDLFDAEHLETGRRLAGRGGLSCISCHEVAGQPSIGLPGMDLAVMHERLRPQWFRRWMREPLAMRAGTRMPTFFDKGRSIITDELDGDAAAQIDALWGYLALGEIMPLPPGVVVDPAAYDLVAVDRPAYVGSFMEGLSARVLSVGFPENVHVAFDNHHVRLARAWTGRFFDAEGTWRGRAGQLEVPPGDRVLDLPPGPAFAFLDDLYASPWPEMSGKPAGWQMLGHVRDAGGLPIFRYAAVGDDGEPRLVVEEAPRPKLGAAGPSLVRHFTLSVHADEPMPVMRAWAGRGADDTIAPTEDRPGAWASTDGVRLVIHDADTHVRTTEDGMELLIVPRVAENADRSRSSTFEVELSW